MAKQPNPFHSGSPVVGDQFGDRRAQTAFLVERMVSGGNVLLVSPRRYGKTSLLLRAVERARARGVRVAHVDLAYCHSLRAVAELLTGAVVTQALGGRRATAERVRTWARRLPGVTPQLEHDGWRFSLGLPQGEATLLEQIRRPVELLTEEAAGHPVALVLDEFQQVAEIPPGTLAGVVKGLTDDLPQVSFIFSGSSRHVLHRLLVDAGAPLQHVAEYFWLDVIPAEEMCPFLARRSLAAGVGMEDAAARLIYDIARGIPHFVQVMAAAAYDAADQFIVEDTVRRGLVGVLARHHALYDERVRGLNAVPRRLVLALAQAPERHLHSAEFGRRADVTVASVPRAQKALEEADVIMWDARVGWRLFDPLFERWLRVARRLDLGERLDPAAIL